MIRKLFKDENAKFLKSTDPVVQEVNSLEEKISGLSNEELKGKTQHFRDEIKVGKTLDEIMPEAFAVVRETAKRTLGQRHYDVQIVGGVALHQGKIAEMKTGEGKTLVATLAVYLNALEGKGVHVVTVNDYLSRRDAVWMGQVYAFLGLSVGVVNSQNESFLYDPGHKEIDEQRDEEGSYKVFYEFLRPVSKKEAYAADITYGTNNEFGFDYLRDNTAYTEGDLSQREFNYAIIDEIDSILIDEARTPLIIAMPSSDSEDLYSKFARIASQLKEEEHYTIDEKTKSIQLNDDGIEKAEDLLGLDNIYTDAGIKYVHHLETAVRAKALFKRDKQYVVRDDEIVIVDDFTGRLQPGRRWSEGLHQAIEAKENVSIKQETRTFASITYQNLFRLYPKLSGMTGTAQSSAEEFYKVYGLETATIPTNRPVQRDDRNDLIFRTEHGKLLAVTNKVKELNEKGQPVLVGTVSIEDNEKISSYFSKAGIPHQVLNAKMHESEGAVIAQGGKKGAVTVATNMAGRGIDIKLGGSPSTEEEYEEVKRIGGLYVIGTERHEARRIDDQLRGRSGRQGDPGATQFYVSLEDQLMRVFATDTIGKMMGKLDMPEDQAIENKLITRSLETAQTKIEGLNFDARKHVLEFDDVMNTQRLSIYGERRSVLLGGPDEVLSVLDDLTGHDAEASKVIEDRRTALGEEAFIEAARRLVLQTIDYFWVQHLEMMDYVRSSVRLRAYGQRDPLVEYKREGLRLFKEMEEAISDRVIQLLPNMGVGAFAKEEERLKKQREKIRTVGGDQSADQSADESGGTVVRREKKIGRNEIVKITNGKETKEIKYKKAQPLIESGEWRLA